MIAYVRKRGQLLTFNALYIGAILVTAALALLGVGAEGATGGRGTGAKHLAHLAAAANPTKMEAARAAATVGVQSAENANRLAFFALTATSIIWFALLRYRSLLLRLAGGLAILILVLTVIKSGSRSGVVNLMILVALLLIQNRPSPGRIAIFILLGFVALGLVVALVPDIVMQRLASWSSRRRTSRSRWPCPPRGGSSCSPRASALGREPASWGSASATSDG